MVSSVLGLLIEAQSVATQSLPKFWSCTVAPPAVRVRLFNAAVIVSVPDPAVAGLNALNSKNPTKASWVKTGILVALSFKMVK